MLQAKDLVKTFDGFRALDGATLTIPKGTVYGLVGPNGAGKSTIIRHFTGVYHQDSGSVTLDGEEIYENEAVKSRIAVIPDDWFYFPQASISTMARFYSRIYPNFNRERFEKLREAFPLNEKQLIARMSKGMQKQAAFWLTLSCMPEYVILDEPVDGLDPVMRRQMWSVLLGDVSSRGTTVLVSSHNLRELEDVCDHVGMMNHGRVIIERSLADMQDYTVKLQMAFPDDAAPELPAELNVLHHSSIGRVHTFIVRGASEMVQSVAAGMNPLFMDILPLTLEEIFIYELGGEGYEAKEIVF